MCPHAWAGGGRREGRSAWQVAAVSGMALDTHLLMYVPMLATSGGVTHLHVSQAGTEAQTARGLAASGAVAGGEAARVLRLRGFRCLQGPLHCAAAVRRGDGELSSAKTTGWLHH